MADHEFVCCLCFLCKWFHDKECVSSVPLPSWIGTLLLYCSVIVCCQDADLCTANVIQISPCFSQMLPRPASHWSCLPSLQTIFRMCTYTFPLWHIGDHKVQSYSILQNFPSPGFVFGILIHVFGWAWYYEHRWSFKEYKKHKKIPSSRWHKPRVATVYDTGTILYL